MFANRVDAGRQLARRLEGLRGSNVVVLGLPRGGVPVAAEVARALNAPLDVILVRKIGVPFHPELAMGAIGEDGVRIVNDDVVRIAAIPSHEFVAVENRERRELERRALLYRGHRPRISLEGRTAIVVDDGVATGSTARAACEVARVHGARRVVLAAPVAPPTVAVDLRGVADDVIFVETPVRLNAVGQWYRDFAATSDDEVVHLLEGAAMASVPTSHQSVHVAVGAVTLEGDVNVPANARGLVLFAHGSGSSRQSPRNRHVAAVLNQSGLATLLFDLLTPSEEADRANVFDVELLGSRLADATRWAMVQPSLRGLPLGYFGASTGAAAAIWAAAEPDLSIRAVVSRGGRPDLAGERVRQVHAPTLLIVGGRDDIVIELNQRAASQLRTEHQMVIVRGATHVFPEPGALEAVADLARDWFVDHLAPTGQRRVTNRGA